MMFCFVIPSVGVTPILSPFLRNGRSTIIKISDFSFIELRFLTLVLNPKMSVPWPQGNCFYIINSDLKVLDGLGKYASIMKAFQVLPRTLRTRKLQVQKCYFSGQTFS